MNYLDIFNAECEKAGVKEIEWSKGNYGSAWIKSMKIKVPMPKTSNTLATALHEVGHIVIGDIKPQYLEEMKAEEFVREKFKDYGIPLKRKIRQKQKEYVKYRVKLSMKRRRVNFGIDKKVEHFLK